VTEVELAALIMSLAGATALGRLSHSEQHAVFEKLAALGLCRHGRCPARAGCRVMAISPELRDLLQKHKIRPNGRRTPVPVSATNPVRFEVGSIDLEATPALKPLRIGFINFGKDA
jgi:hypothetical protein